MSNWEEDVSALAKAVMMNFGDFYPTVNIKDRLVKGHVDGDKCYYDSHDLREISAACLEVAAWLDKRADEVKP